MNTWRMDGEEDLSCLQIPHAYRSGNFYRYETCSIGVKSQRADGLFVLRLRSSRKRNGQPAKVELLAARREIPHDDGFVVAARSEPFPVGTKRKRLDGLRMPHT